MSNFTIPDLEPDYELSLDDLDDAANNALYSGRGGVWNALRIEWMNRRRQRDFVLDLQDQINDAGLVIVSADRLQDLEIAAGSVGE